MVVAGMALVARQTTPNKLSGAATLAWTALWIPMTTIQPSMATRTTSTGLTTMEAMRKEETTEMEMARVERIVIENIRFD